MTGILWYPKNGKEAESKPETAKSLFYSAVWVDGSFYFQLMKGSFAGGKGEGFYFDDCHRTGCGTNKT